MGSCHFCCSRQLTRFVVAVGKEAFSTHGAHGAQKHVATRHFYTFLEARDYLKEEGCTICGVEILEGASGET
jgi:hypothetical protein